MNETNETKPLAPAPGSAACCPHCGSGLLWSEDRGAHCDGCDDFNEESDLPNSELSGKEKE